LLLSGLLFFVFGWQRDFLMAQTMALPPTLAGLALYCHGPKFFKALSFPIGYLVLLIPPPLGLLDAITLPMRHWASAVAEITLQGIGHDVIRQGLLITVGENDIYMGERCSGFRSLITMISLGLIYAWFIRLPPQKNIAFLAAIIPLAILGNFIRVIILCLVTIHFGKEIGEGFFHDFSGGLMFMLMILFLMGWQKFLIKAF
jgi:exosortase